MQWPVTEGETCSREIDRSTLTRSTVSNLEQVANLYCVVRPTQLPSLAGWESSNNLPSVSYVVKA